MKYLIERINVNPDFSGVVSCEANSLCSVYCLLLCDFNISDKIINNLILTIKSLTYGDFIIYKNVRVTCKSL